MGPGSQADPLAPVLPPAALMPSCLLPNASTGSLIFQSNTEDERDAARKGSCESYRTGSLASHGSFSGTAALLEGRSIVPNPFEDPEARYLAIMNDEGQHSLWPASIDVPDGWVVVHDTDTRSHCVGYIEENWTDMRPKSLTASRV